MVAIASLLFCDDCGNLLDTSTGERKAKVECDVCGSTTKDTTPTTVVTRSKPSDFPSALRAKRSQVQTLTEENTRKDAAIEQPCPKCGRKEVRFYTQQLRSADEGTTVFYSCDCGHKWNDNN